MDRREIERLYLRYGPMIERRARRLLGNPHAAADATHEVFLRALRHADRFRDQSAPTTWLFQITTNYCLNVLRDRARRAALWAAWLPAEPAESTAGDAEHRVLLGQLVDRVAPELLEIAIYHLVDELTHDEIAELVGVSRRTIGNRLEAFRAAIHADLALEAKP